MMASILVVSMWLWAWLPQLIDRVGLGRQTVIFGAAARRSSEAQLAYVVIIAAMLIAALVIIFVEVQRGSVPGGGVATLVLAPWVGYNALYVATGGRNTEVLVFPVVVIALLLCLRTRQDIYKTLRILASVTIVSSLALGTFLPGYFLSQNDETISNEKAIFGAQLLNGLFPTSNQLGIFIALALPLLFTVRAPWLRRVLLFLAVAVLLWSAARTAIASGMVVALLWCAVRPIVRVESFARVVAISSVIGLGIAALLPFAVSDTSDFSRRALIWEVSLSKAFEARPFFGLGTFVFRSPSPVTEGVGAITNTGHNLFVSAFTIGGVVALLAIMGFLVAWLRSAVMLAADDLVPLMTLLAVAFLAPLEDPFRGFVVAPASFVLAPVVTYCLRAGGMRAGSANDTAPQPRPELTRRR